MYRQGRQDRRERRRGRTASRRNLRSALFVLSFTFASEGLPAQTEVPKYQPHQIMLNLTAAPATSMAVTWRTLEPVSGSIVEYARATDGTTFTDQTVSIPAVMTPWPPKEGPNATWHSAVMTGLTPASGYVYRVGKKGSWSEWNQFRTADDSPSPFSFVFLGDPQNDIRAHVSRVFREAYRSVPDARFWLFTGDLTTTPTEDLWNEWFDAAGFIHSTLPSIMVPGNHDYGTILLAGARTHNNAPHRWRAQFTLPENGLPGLEETSYVIDYQGVRFVMVNSNTRLAEQAAWMDSALSATPCRWNIVAFHHPVYSTAAGRDNVLSREAFRPVFEKHHVDLVLQGHDHTYSRTYRLTHGRIAEANEHGTVYVVSSSGPKMYSLSEKYRPIMASMGEGLQLYQVITVDGTMLRYRAVTAAGSVYDSFELSK